MATALTTYSKPFHIARKYGSLDHISGRRGRWNIVTSLSDAEARAKYDDMNALVDPLFRLSYLYGQVGDLSGYDVDGPVPKPTNPQVPGMARNLLAPAERDEFTIPQLYTKIAAGFGTRVVIGTRAQIVDDMQAWVTGDAADGFNICLLLLPQGVMPELRRCGLFHTEYEGPTLRQNLGLALRRSRCEP